MSDAVSCPSCGTVNPAGSESCSSCNFPLRAPTAAPRASEPARPAAEEPVRIERPLPYRPRRRPGGPANQQAMTLWLVFGAIAAAAVIFVAFQATLQHKADAPTVEGANADAQKHVDELRALLSQDSTNINARQQLADILYDTANWNDAIVQYRSVVRQDSSRATAIVDLGVCYYNLGFVDEAKRHFELGLKRQSDHPIALFNLGIVAERQNDLEGALKYYHRAVQSNPPENMMSALTEAVMRVSKALGRSPRPLTGAPGAGMPPQGMPPSGR